MAASKEHDAASLFLPIPAMKPGWRSFFLGAAVAAAVLVLGAAFLAYQAPELLLDWVNLRYCG